MTIIVRVTLDELLPSPDVRTAHARRIAAPPDAVWAALSELRLSALPLSRLLMAARMLPGRGDVRLLDRPPVPVLERRADALLAGGVLQPWKLRGAAKPPRLDAPELIAFAEPGWVKAGLEFAVAADGAGAILSTETRVTATDPATRRRFRAYWTVVGAGSSLIRRDVLRAVARGAGG